MQLGDRVFVYGDRDLIGEISDREFETIFDAEGNVVDSIERFGARITANPKARANFAVGSEAWGIAEDFELIR